MRVATVVVYDYMELSDEAKKVVREMLAGNKHEQDENLVRDVFNELVMYLFGNTAENIEYSLSSCQGDGVRFEYEMSLPEFKEFIRKIEEYSPECKEINNRREEMLRSLQSVVKPLSEDIHNRIATIEKFSHCNEGIYDFSLYSSREANYHRYTHYNTVKHCYAYSLVEDDIDAEAEKVIEETSKNLKQIMFVLYRAICAYLEKAGYEIFESEWDDEYIKDLCEENEWEFTKDGKLH